MNVITITGFRDDAYLTSAYGVILFCEEDNWEKVEQKPNFSEKDSTDFKIEVHEIIAQARNDSRLNDADVLKQFEEEAAFALMLKANKLIEQKPAEWSYPYGKNETVDQLIAIAECLEMDGDCSFNGYKGEDCGKFLRELARRESENKPAEWSEEDEKFINELCGLLAAIAKDGYVGRYYAPDLVNRLKSLRPQPKQEWSEEDEECRQELIQYIEQRIGDGTTGQYLWNKWHRWLKDIPNRISLRPQPKDEWSKEDESILNNIIAYKYLNVDDLEWIKNLPKRFGLQPKQEWSEEDEWKLNEIIKYLEDKGDYRSCWVSFLKDLPNRFSLRPSWKPTDEQYYALRDAIIKLDADDSDARFPWKDLPILHSLRNDLEKLRK